MTIIPKSILDILTLKNIKQNIGHDLNGAFADVCINGKKVGHYNDDGWGGESEIRLEGDNFQKLVDLCRKHEVDQLMINNGWDFMKDGIDDHTMVDFVISEVMNVKAREKDYKSGMLTGKDQTHYQIHKFTGCATLEKAVQKYGVAAITQSLMGAMLAEKKKGNKVLNMDVLESLGIKF